MAQNKNALIRYRTIDKCLQNPYRQWTLDDLIESCSEALYEYEGRQVAVSKRTVQLDLQTMRSDKLGYNAPIVVYDKKYYKYEDPDFTITDIPLNDSDMSVLSESVEILKQFKDFSLFSELGGIIQRLEDKVYTEKTNQDPVIHLDKNEQLKGLEHLDTLYQAILKQLVLNITYQSFKARSATDITIHPYILKEFNNRWFLIGKVGNSKATKMLTLALDRIQKIDYDLKTDYEKKDFNADDYYRNTVGVTVLPEEHVMEVVLRFDKSNAPYVETKPLHPSQKVIKRSENGHVTVQIQVHLNFELDRLILGFGDSVKVIRPRILKKRIRNKLKSALELYRKKVTKDKPE